MSDPMESLRDPNFTFHVDSYSCLRDAYWAHIIFAYLIGISGICCFVTRLIPQIKWMHVWFGRLYIIFMLWGTATSLLIHNTGLPTGVLLSFLWCLLGLTIGWWVINAHQVRMDKQARRRVQERIKLEGAAAATDLDQAINQEKANIAANKTFVQRLLSLKALHGSLMVLSWVNIAGRIFVTPIRNDFACYTYPVYKQIETHKTPLGANETLTFVPTHDPEGNAPWIRMGVQNWGVALSIGPLAAAFVFGAIWSFIAGRRAARRQGSRTSPHPLVSVEAGQALGGEGEDNAGTRTPADVQ